MLGLEALRLAIPDVNAPPPLFDMDGMLLVNIFSNLIPNTC